MKIICLLAVCALLLVACVRAAPTEQHPGAEESNEQTSAQTPEPEAKPNPEAKAMSYKLAIEGMSCVNCVGRVKSILEELPGVQSAEVDLEHHSAVVKVKPGATFDEAAARDALDADMFTLTECSVQ